MVQLPAAFNPGAPGQEGITDFKAIDAGEYVAHIVSSKMVETKAKDGQYLELIWQILIGDNAGRKIWSRLNLINNSTATVKIANKHLKSICDAVGIPGPVSNSDVLHARACIIRVTVTPATSLYPEGNEIKNYAPYGSPGAGAATLPAAAAITPAVSASAAVAAPAWGAPPAAVPEAGGPAPGVLPAVPAPAPAVPAPAVPVVPPVAAVPTAAQPHPVPAADLGAPGVPLPVPVTPDPAAIAAAEAAAAAPHIPEAAPVAPDAEPGAGPTVPDEKPPWLR